LFVVVSRSLIKFDLIEREKYCVGSFMLFLSQFEINFVMLNWL